MLIIELDENIPWVKSMLKATGMEMTERKKLGRWFVHDRFHEMYLIEAEQRKPVFRRAGRRR